MKLLERFYKQKDLKEHLKLASIYFKNKTKYSDNIIKLIDERLSLIENYTYPAKFKNSFNPYFLDTTSYLNVINCGTIIQQPNMMGTLTNQGIQSAAALQMQQAAQNIMNTNIPITLSQEHGFRYNVTSGDNND